MRPYVILNAAMTLDGKIATQTGSSNISGKKDLERVHEIRKDCDAIMVGIGTVLADDPRLTVHKIDAMPEDNPVRVVVDSKCRTPADARITNSDAKTIIAGANEYKWDFKESEKYKELTDKGVKFYFSGNKRVDLKALMSYLHEEGIEKLNGLDIDKAIIDDGEIGEKVLKTCPEGVEKILDLIGPSHMKDTMNALKFRGILCVTGILGGVEYIENFDPITDVPNGKYLTGFFSNYPTQKTIDRMFEFIIKNEIKPDIAAVFNDLEDIPKAHMLMESNKAQGKIIFKLDDS